MDYQAYKQALTILAVTTEDDAAFNDILPQVIAYAEKRIYRELDLLQTVVQDSSLTFTAGNRERALPTDAEWITVQQVNVITPAGAASANAGLRNPLTPTSRQWLNYVYGSATGSGVPQFFAMKDQETIFVGPWPDAAYRVEFVGTIRPVPLSPDNDETFLSRDLPDLFLAASMVFVTGYQRDFGSQSDDPKAAQSWEQQYQTLFASANAEEMRKKFAMRVQ